MKLLPIILSGGSGTRLWPVSRESMPKPFMKMADGKSLLRLTHDRATQLPGVVGTVVVTNNAYSYKTVEELAGAVGAESLSLLLEPVGRNTAAAVLLAALWAAEKYGDDVVLVVLPADHLVEPRAAFVNAVVDAVPAALNGSLVLFGITPSGPETGFGYIEWGAASDDGRTHVAKRFVEKPSREKAVEYLSAGNFAWNSGMFCFTAQAIVAAFRDCAPEAFGAAMTVFGATDRSGVQVNFDAETFSALPNISIDYAVMERASNVVVIPCDFTWNDIGSWKAVSDATACDADGNSCEGRAILIKSTGTYVRASERLVAAVGVKDLVIVDTGDAVLVAHKDSSEEVKQIVHQLHASGDLRAKEHLTVERPWGSYTVLHEGLGFKVKRIEVKPGQRLSLQLHHQRSEHWVGVEGEGQAIIDGTTHEIVANKSVYVPKETKHRLQNFGDKVLVIIEVQCGDYLGEDDIVRFSDEYGRIKAAPKADDETHTRALPL